MKGVELEGDLTVIPHKKLAGNVTDIKECVRRCCGIPDCTVAYEEDHTCYVVQCLNTTSCKAKVSMATCSLGYVIRNGWSLFPKQQDALNSVMIMNGQTAYSTAKESQEPIKSDNKNNDNSKNNNYNNNNIETNKNATVTTENLKMEENKTSVHDNKEEKQINTGEEEFCSNNGTLTDQRFVAGMKAGIFTDQGDVGPDGLKNCIKFCCLDKLCDVAYMVETKCYTVQCFNELSCRTFPTPNFFLNPVIARIIRKKPSRNFLLTSDSVPSLKNSHNYTVQTTSEKDRHLFVSDHETTGKNAGAGKNKNKALRVKDKLGHMEAKGTTGDKKDIGTHTRINNNQTQSGEDYSGSGDENLSLFDGSGVSDVTTGKHHGGGYKEDKNNTVAENDGDKYYFPLNDVDMRTIQSLSSDNGKSYFRFLMFFLITFRKN